jgi:hypothetical protein
VFWDKRDKKWRVRAWRDETHKLVGSSANEKEAAEIYDDYCDDHDLGWPLNFPSRLGSLYTVQPFPNKHNPKKRKAASGETTTKPGKKKRSRK